MRKRKIISAVISLFGAFAFLTACGTPAETGAIPASTTETTGTTVSSSTGDSGTTPSGTEGTAADSTSASTGATGTVASSEPLQTAPPSTTKPKPPTSNIGTSGDSGNSGDSGKGTKNTSSQTIPATTAPTEHKAGKGDEKAVADKVLEYINQFRQEGGVPAATKLPGLTEYSEYRSRQLVTNFEHDTHDIRAAAAELKYGEYIIPSEWGMTGDPYYEVNAREAIGYNGISGSIDTVAKTLASQFRESSGHWTYVGADATYSFIAVGITYEKGLWYCCINMGRMNLDQLYNYQP